MSLALSREISLEAKGLFTILQALPDGTEFTYENISHYTLITATDLRKLIKELSDAGFLVKKRSKGAGYIYVVEPAIDPAQLESTINIIGAHTVKNVIVIPVPSHRLITTRKQLYDKIYNVKKGEWTRLPETAPQTEEIDIERPPNIIVRKSDSKVSVVLKVWRRVYIQNKGEDYVIRDVDVEAAKRILSKYAYRESSNKVIEKDMGNFFQNFFAITLEDDEYMYSRASLPLIANNLNKIKQLINKKLFH